MSWIFRRRLEENFFLQLLHLFGDPGVDESDDVSELLIDMLRSRVEWIS